MEGGLTTTVIIIIIIIISHTGFFKWVRRYSEFQLNEKIYNCVQRSVSMETIFSLFL